MKECLRPKSPSDRSEQRPRRNRKLWPVLLLYVGVLTWLPAGAVGATEGKVKVFVSILPFAYFVERIGGPYVDTTVLVGPGQEPHTFELTPQLMVKLSEARIFFRNGFRFEDTLIKKVGSIYKNLEVVDTRTGIKLRPISDEHTHHGHDHNRASGPHDEDELDPHTWLDPQNAKVQARIIADTLKRVDLVHADLYDANLKAFEADLDELDAKLANALAPVKGKKFFVYHPAYGYFGDRYGLEQVPVQISGKEPSARQLAKLIDQGRRAGAKVIFVQPQFSKKSAEALAAAIDGAVVPLDDLAKDYLKNLQEMATKLEVALKAQKD